MLQCKALAAPTFRRISKLRLKDRLKLAVRCVQIYRMYWAWQRSKFYSFHQPLQILKLDFPFHSLHPTLITFVLVSLLVKLF